MTSDGVNRPVERTAPRRVEDCPTPRSEYTDLREVWIDLGNEARTRKAFDQWLDEPDLRSEIESVNHLRWMCDRFLAARRSSSCSPKAPTRTKSLSSPAGRPIRSATTPNRTTRRG